MQRPLIHFLLFGLVAALALPAGAADPPASKSTSATSQPVDSPPANFSSEECLAVGRELLEQDNFPRARAWFEAALDRDSKPAAASEAKLALERLELLGRFAPRLSVKEWIQGAPPSAQRLGGKVLVIFFFEAIDPAVKHAVSEMNVLVENNRKNDFEAIGIASVLGEVEHQQPGDIRSYLADERIKYRVGIDDGGVLSLHAYKGKGVPHYAVIDRAGRVRRLGVYSPAEIDFAVRKLLAESPDTRLPGERLVMPQSREGRELIDTRAPRLKSDVWANTTDNRPPEILGRPRLVRFFMSNCPYCRASAPALNRIHRDFAGKGLQVIGVYHPKPEPRAVSEDEFRRAVRQLELEFPCTVDADWSFLRRLWLDAGDGHREFTSATFLIDRRGRIRFVHPGPDFFPSDKPENARQNDDYEAVRAGVEKLLSE